VLHVAKNDLQGTLDLLVQNSFTSERVLVEVGLNQFRGTAAHYPDLRRDVDHCGGCAIQYTGEHAKASLRESNAQLSCSENDLAKKKTGPLLCSVGAHLATGAVIFTLMAAIGSVVSSVIAAATCRQGVSHRDLVCTVRRLLPRLSAGKFERLLLRRGNEPDSAAAIAMKRRVSVPRYKGWYFTP
jgi:hypothetical protein